MIIVYCVPSPLCLRRIQSIFCFTPLAPTTRLLDVKDVIVLIKASKVDKTERHIPTLYGSIPLEKCEIHVNMKCIVPLQARAITGPDINFKSSSKRYLSLAWQTLQCIEAMNVMEMW